MLVVSDEIHQDFAFERKHYVFADLKKEYGEITVTCTAPSKTFNLAGLQLSNIFISNPEMRKAFCRQMDLSGYGEVNVMGLAACEAAYRDGDEWYEAMRRYVKANLEFIKEYVEKNMAGVVMAEHEGESHRLLRAHDVYSKYRPALLIPPASIPVPRDCVDYRG